MITAIMTTATTTITLLSQYLGVNNITMGHEVAGMIITVGENVEKSRIGI